MSAISTFRGALRLLYPTALGALVVFALLLWWRSGMWWYGELPTHGMQLVASFAVAALVLFFLKRLVGRSGR